MMRGTLIGSLALLALWGSASTAMAQQTPPTLEIDFVNAVLPLSPALTVLIAAMVAAVGIFLIRRTRGRSRLLSTVAVGLVALGFGNAVIHAPLISRASAALPDTTLALTTSPAIFTSFFVGFVHVTNGTGQDATITAIKFDPHGANYFISAPETNCAVGLALSPGASCVITLRTTG